MCVREFSCVLERESEVACCLRMSERESCETMKEIRLKIVGVGRCRGWKKTNRGEKIEQGWCDVGAEIWRQIFI